MLPAGGYFDDMKDGIFWGAASSAWRRSAPPTEMHSIMNGIRS